jgi:squalene synthase HpnC
MTTRSPTYTTPRAGAVTPVDGLPDQADLSGRARLENFTVASRLLPAASRAHLMAFYSYARLVDEIGDSYHGDRLAALDAIEAETRRAVAGPGSARVPPVVAAAAQSVKALRTDPEPLFRLIEANRRDQIVSVYETFDDLLGYCALSANPVGHLVLAALGATTPEHLRWSDAICTGLQLTEHWQDVAEDAASGRIYLPQVDMRRFGVDRADLKGRAAAGPQVRALLMFEVWRARRLLGEGTPLITALRGRARWAVAGFWAGGQAALDAIANRDFDVLRGPPRASRARVAALTIAAFRGAAHREAA